MKLNEKGCVKETALIILQISGAEVKGRLKSIRNTFRRALFRKPKSGSAGDVVIYNAREKKLLDLLHFLKPHIKPLSTVSSLEVCGTFCVVNEKTKKMPYNQRQLPDPAIWYINCPQK